MGGLEESEDDPELNLEKLDSIQDGFIHYRLLRFCQSTRLQYANSHILLRNRCVLRQYHVDSKIVYALLKRGTKQHTDGWDAPSKDWEHMVLHLPHAEGGFGVTFNDVTEDAVFYTTTSRFVTWLGSFSQKRQVLWLSKDDLQDSSSWSSSPLLLLRDNHSNRLTQYNCNESCVPSQSQTESLITVPNFNTPVKDLGYKDVKRPCLCKSQTVGYVCGHGYPVIRKKLH